MKNIVEIYKNINHLAIDRLNKHIDENEYRALLTSDVGGVDATWKENNFHVFGRLNIIDVDLKNIVGYVFLSAKNDNGSLKGIERKFPGSLVISDDVVSLNGTPIKYDAHKTSCAYTLATNKRSQASSEELW